MKMTIIYDNLSFKEGIKPDWGFSALIEISNRSILFDTGASASILQSNMESLGIDPKNITDVFISHSHFDHTGGLTFVLYENPKVKLWVPYVFPNVYGFDNVIKVKDPIKLYDGIYSTGTIDHIEHSLCIELKKGILVVVGCAHPPISKILKRASSFGKVWGIIGGMHSNRPEEMKGKGLEFIAPLHCSQYRSEIKEVFSDVYLDAGAGSVIEFD